MDPLFIRSALTVLLFVAFIGIVVWAYSASNRKRFEEAAQLPFADEARSAKQEPRDE